MLEERNRGKVIIPSTFQGDERHQSQRTYEDDRARGKLVIPATFQQQGDVRQNRAEEERARGKLVIPAVFRRSEDVQAQRLEHERSKGRVIIPAIYCADATGRQRTMAEERARCILMYHAFQLEQQEEAARQNRRKASQIASQAATTEQERRILEWNTAVAEAKQAEQEHRLMSLAETISAETGERNSRLNEIENADAAAETERQIAFVMAMNREQKERIRRFLEKKISDRVTKHYEREERDVAFVHAMELEQKERTRRFLEDKISERVTHHFERAERERNQAISLRAQELERERRVLHSKEDQERVQSITAMMHQLGFNLNPTSARSPSPSVFPAVPIESSLSTRAQKDKEKRNLENVAFTALGDFLGLNGLGRDSQKRRNILNGTIEKLQTLREEQRRLLHEKSRLTTLKSGISMGLAMEDISASLPYSAPFCFHDSSNSNSNLPRFSAGVPHNMKSRKTLSLDSRNVKRPRDQSSLSTSSLISPACVENYTQSNAASTPIKRQRDALFDDADRSGPFKFPCVTAPLPTLQPPQAVFTEKDVEGDIYTQLAFTLGVTLHPQHTPTKQSVHVPSDDCITDWNMDEWTGPLNTSWLRKLALHPNEQHQSLMPTTNIDDNMSYFLS